MQRHDIEPHSVAIIGQGNDGLLMSMLAVAAENCIIGNDDTAARVDMLKSKTTCVEDILSVEIAVAPAADRFVETAEVSDCAGPFAGRESQWAK